jgi:hypothetical protein
MRLSTLFFFGLLVACLFAVVYSVNKPFEENKYKYNQTYRAEWNVANPGFEKSYKDSWDPTFYLGAAVGAVMTIVVAAAAVFGG